MAAGVNLQQLRVEFERKLFDTNQFKGLAIGIAQRRVNVAQNTMVQAFEENPVTVELKGGADYSGPSVVKYFRSDVNTNLYSFVGFPQGTDPLKLLRELLKYPIEVKLTTRVKNTYYFRVLVPTRKDMEEATPLPAEYYSGDFSWAAAVEEGDGEALGIGQFLAVRVSASRSGGGIQVEDMSPQSSSVQATPYITAILEAFREKLQQLTS
jgi:small nuclear ribonucleoprotein (snRNP)-like protein